MCLLLKASIPTAVLVIMPFFCFCFCFLFFCFFCVGIRRMPWGFQEFLFSYCLMPPLSLSETHQSQSQHHCIGHTLLLHFTRPRQHLRGALLCCWCCGSVTESDSEWAKLACLPENQHENDVSLWLLMMQQCSDTVHTPAMCPKVPSLLPSAQIFFFFLPLAQCLQSD